MLSYRLKKCIELYGNRVHLCGRPRLPDFVICLLMTSIVGMLAVVAINNSCNNSQERREAMMFIRTPGGFGIVGM